MTPGIGLHGVTLRWVPLIGMDPKPPRPAAPAVHTPVLVKGRSHTEPVRQRQILALLTDTWQTTVALRERLGIDKGAVTSAVKELEAKGLASVNRPAVARGTAGVFSARLTARGAAEAAHWRWQS